MLGCGAKKRGGEEDEFRFKRERGQGGGRQKKIRKVIQIQLRQRGCAEGQTHPNLDRPRGIIYEVHILVKMKCVPAAQERHFSESEELHQIPFNATGVYLNPPLCNCLRLQEQKRGENVGKGTGWGGGGVVC